MGEENADPGPGVSRRNPLSRYVRRRGRRETGLKKSRRCTAGVGTPEQTSISISGMILGITLSAPLHKYDSPTSEWSGVSPTWWLERPSRLRCEAP